MRELQDTQAGRAAAECCFYAMPTVKRHLHRVVFISTSLLIWIEVVTLMRDFLILPFCLFGRVAVRCSCLR